jgi:predicted TIM-barrel fold metal-dependent hydrolase
MRAIDAWLNVNMGELGMPAYMRAAAKDVFKSGDDYWRDMSVSETLAMMDELGVERAILMTDAGAPSKHVLAFPAAAPERFALAAKLDPRRGVAALRELASYARSEPVVLACVTPFTVGLPPSDAVYFPLYAKCIDLGLPLALTTGIPGPPAPATVQDPLALDDVCLAFPELTLVMAHGADPWWDVAIRLMLKYARLHLMTSAYLPKYLPPSLLHFMRTRGRDRVIFASDHPAIPMKRCLDEAMKLDLPEPAREAYLYGNAARLFFARG